MHKSNKKHGGGLVKIEKVVELFENILDMPRIIGADSMSIV